MNADQMQLFYESSTSSSDFDAQSSRVSSVPASYSDAQQSKHPTDASAITTNHRAKASSMLDGADVAASRSRFAKRTAASAAQPMLSTIITPKHTADPTFEIQRPKTREECRDEDRLKIPREVRPLPAPCPWVGCRHHLLFEVTSSAKPKLGRDARPTTLRLNMASKGRSSHGRRRGLSSSSARDLVRNWIDDAIEHLQTMTYTCALDVVDDFPDGIRVEAIGWLLGMTRQAADAAESESVGKLEAQMKEYAPDSYEAAE